MNMEIKKPKISIKLIETLFIFFPVALLFSNIVSELILGIFILLYFGLSKNDKIIKGLKDPIIIFYYFFGYIY